MSISLCSLLLNLVFLPWANMLENLKKSFRFFMEENMGSWLILARQLTNDSSTNGASKRLKPGDEIIVPAVSWPTTYFPLKQYNLKLVLLM